MMEFSEDSDTSNTSRPSYQVRMHFTNMLTFWLIITT